MDGGSEPSGLGTYKLCTVCTVKLLEEESGADPAVLRGFYPHLKWVGLRELWISPMFDFQQEFLLPFLTLAFSFQCDLRACGGFHG